MIIGSYAGSNGSEGKVTESNKNCLTIGTQCVNVSMGEGVMKIKAKILRGRDKSEIDVTARVEYTKDCVVLIPEKIFGCAGPFWGGEYKRVRGQKIKVMNIFLG